MSNPLPQYLYHVKELNTVLTNLQKSLSNANLLDKANQTNLQSRLSTIQHKMSELSDDIEELQYDLDKEEIKDKPDPETEERIADFERTYDMMQPVLGLALISYLNGRT